jgi:hypothetical protein
MSEAYQSPAPMKRQIAAKYAIRSPDRVCSRLSSRSPSSSKTRRHSAGITAQVTVASYNRPMRTVAFTLLLIIAASG